MSDWKAVRLDECCEIVGGATPSTAIADYWNGDIYWATPKDLSELEEAYISKTPRKLTQAGLNSCAATVLPAGSVLFSSRAPIGHVAINTVPMATNQGFKSFVPNPNQIEPKFLYHWLRKNRVYLENLGNGATFKEVSKTVVSRIEISLPPLPEQRRIAEVLDRAEALRAKRRAALAQLDTLTQAIFLDMFGDPATNPKGFQIVKFVDVCERIFKGAFDLKASSYLDQGIPFIRIADIQQNTIDLSNAVYIDERTYLEHRRSELNCGDIIFSKVGTIDRIAVIPEMIPRCIISQNNVGAKLRSDVVHSNYTLAFLTSNYALGKIRAGSKKAVQDKLVLEELRQLPFTLPTLDLQCKFARRVAAGNKLKTAHRASLAELEALFAALQYRAFRGEL